MFMFNLIVWFGIIRLSTLNDGYVWLIGYFCRFLYVDS